MDLHVRRVIAPLERPGLGLEDHHTPVVEIFVGIAPEDEPLEGLCQRAHVRNHTLVDVIRRTRGADMKVHVRTPRQAELAALMPEKLPPDTSKMLLCPMPGLIVKVEVEVGQEVQEGQSLCTVEAMKMENILRAEKKSVVARINAGPGDSLAVDDVIMEFE